MWKKSSAVAVLFVVTIAAAWCKDEQVKILAKTTRAVVEACDQVLIDVDKMQVDGLMTDAENRMVYGIVKKIALADRQANAMVKPLVNLDAKTKLDLLKLVEPILTVIDDAIKTDLLTITNPDTRNKITIALQTIRLSVEAALVVLR